MQTYRSKEDSSIPQRPASDVFPFAASGSLSDSELLAQQPKEILRHYNKRYFLFSKFDRGI